MKWNSVWQKPMPKSIKKKNVSNGAWQNRRGCCLCRKMQIISTFDFSMPICAHTMRMHRNMDWCEKVERQMFTIISMAELHAHECVLHLPHTTRHAIDVAGPRGCISAPGTFENEARSGMCICKFSRKYSFSCRFTNKKSKQREKYSICAIFYFALLLLPPPLSAILLIVALGTHSGGGGGASPKSHLLHYAQNGNMCSCVPLFCDSRFVSFSTVCCRPTSDARRAHTHTHTNSQDNYIIIMFLHTA